MANVMYPIGKKAILDGGVAHLTDTIKVVLIDTAVVTYNAAHDFLNDVSAGIVGTAVTLGTKTTTGGVFDAADATIPTVAGATAEAVVIYKDTGSAATSPLLAWIDSATGLPVTPNGGDIILQWHASGIYGI